MEIAFWELYTLKLCLLTMLGWMKLPELPLSMRPSTSFPLRRIATTAPDNILGEAAVVIEAKVTSLHRVVDALTGTDVERQTLEKCPFLWHLWHTASHAGHLIRGCHASPQKKHFVVTAATTGGHSTASSVVVLNTRGCAVPYITAFF